MTDTELCANCKHVDECDACEYECPPFKVMARYKKALNQVAFPVDCMLQEAKEQGMMLDGVMAIYLSQDASYLKTIAKDVLKE